MPVASTSSIEIAQRACTMAGIPRISTFEDASNEVAIVLNDIYEDVVTDCLTIHQWRFASFSATLGPPLVQHQPGFSHAYALPNDPEPLLIRTVYLGGSLVPRYKLMLQQIWLDGSDTQEVEIDALWRMPETVWPPWFRMYAISRLAGFLAAAITRNGEIAGALLKEAEGQLARSRTRDSQQQTTSKIHLTKIRSARLGGRPF